MRENVSRTGTWKRSFAPESPRCERNPAETASWQLGTERRRQAPASAVADTAPCWAAPVGSAASANQHTFGIERRDLRGEYRDETKECWEDSNWQKTGQLKTTDGSVKGKTGVWCWRGDGRGREFVFTKTGATANETENHMDSHSIGQVEQSETKRDSG